MKTCVHFVSDLVQCFLEWEMFQTEVERIKTQFKFNNFFQNCVVYEIKWKNIAEPSGHGSQYGACALLDN
jgi:hypothetical protein